jgi:DNA-binding MarR family transcriptional regulator
VDELHFEQRVEAVRRFNRFYTRQIGVLHEGLLQSPFSLAEARVLYELAHRAGPTASELGKDLGLDPGYLSRILRDFAKRGLLDKTPSKVDGRQSHLALTARGREAFAPLDSRSRDEIGAMLRELPPAEQTRLIDAMQTVERLLGGRPDPKVPYLLRPHRPGDIGWVIHRHAALYAQEYGWDGSFEALVADIVGSVFLVSESKTVAKLRLLLVEPKARGLGIGHRLVDECVRFAGDVGYRKLTLWTNDILVAARRIYEAKGFHLVAEEPHNSFGHDLIGQNWELDL